MTLLSICAQVANYIPVTAPLTIFGNADQTAQLLLACAQDEGEALARRPQGGWVCMIREYDFRTAAVGPFSGSAANSGAGGVAVITGLSSTTGIVANTWYAFGTGLPIDTIVASVDSSSQVTLNNAASQTGAGTFQFGQSDYALPSDFERPIDNTFWDRSRFWAMRGPLSPQQWQLYKSSVIGNASIQRRYRFRQISGTPGSMRLSIDPVPLDNGSALVFEYVSNAWCQSAVFALQTAWAADTDLGVLSEYLLRLGIRYRILRRLGMSYAEELDEYERQCDKAVAHDGGAPILDLTPTQQLSLLGPWNLPETGFGP